MTKQRYTFGNVNVHMTRSNPRDVEEPGPFVYLTDYEVQMADFQQCGIYVC